MPTLSAKMPDGNIWDIDGPEGATQEQITARILALHPEAGKAQESLMRRAARFDIGRDAITPALSAIVQRLPYAVPGAGLAERLTGQSMGVPKGAADFAAKAVVPQTPAEALLAVAPGGAGVAKLASKVPLIGGLFERKLLGPALGRTLTSTAAGAAGGALGPEGALGGGAMGLGSGVVGEGLGYLGGKLARSAPGAERSIAGGDQKDLVREMVKAVPQFRQLPGKPVNLNDPTQLMEAVKQNRLGAVMSDMADEAGMAIDRGLRGQRISVPELGPEPRSVQQAWREISEIGQKGYGGTKADPTQRTMTALEQREMRTRALDQMNQALISADPTGRASRIFDPARHTYSTGMSYLDMFNAPGAFSEKGRAFLDVPKVQHYNRGEQGALLHQTAEGEIAGGRMASAPRTYTGERGEATFSVPPAPAREPLAVTPAPPPASVTIPGRDDFTPMVGALHRGGGLGEMDYDWISNLLPGAGMGSGLGRFVLRGAGLLPNAGRVYAGQTPRTLPGGAQQVVNYELLKAIQGLSGQGGATP